jgi:hypothetical protein
MGSGEALAILISYASTLALLSELLRLVAARGGPAVDATGRGVV